jgi:hypothetical protein
MNMSKKADPVIRFRSQTWSIKTLANGEVSVTLSLSDKDIKQILKLLECKKSNAVLDVTAVPIKPAVKVKEKHVRPKRVQRYPYRANS